MRAVSTRKYRVPAIKDRRPQRTHKLLAVALTVLRLAIQLCAASLLDSSHLDAAPGAMIGSESLVSNSEGEMKELEHTEEPVWGGREDELYICVWHINYWLARSIHDGNIL